MPEVSVGSDLRESANAKYSSNKYNSIWLYSNLNQKLVFSPLLIVYCNLAARYLRHYGIIQIIVFRASEIND